MPLPTAYRRALEGISDVRAVKYFEDTEMDCWARHAVPDARHGHNTSNIAESLNSSFKEIQQLPSLDRKSVV